MQHRIANESLMQSRRSVVESRQGIIDSPSLSKIWAPALNQTGSWKETPFPASSSGVMHPRAPSMAHLAWMTSISLSEQRQQSARASSHRRTFAQNKLDYVAMLVSDSAANPLRETVIRSKPKASEKAMLTCNGRRSVGLRTDRLCPSRSHQRTLRSGSRG